MSVRKPFIVHVEEVRHFQFEVWATDADEARDGGVRIWRKADTTGQWELPDTETRYSATPTASYPTSDEKR